MPPIRALIKGEDVRHDAASDGFNFVLRNVGVVDYFLASAHYRSPYSIFKVQINLYLSYLSATAAAV